MAYIRTRIYLVTSIIAITDDLPLQSLGQDAYSNNVSFAVDIATQHV
jgi:hypothetical protein